MRSGTKTSTASGGASGQFTRADDGNGGAGHPQSALARRRVRHGRQQVGIDAGRAQQRDRTGRRAVPEYGFPGRTLRGEPLAQRVALGTDLALQAAHHGRAGDAVMSLTCEQRAHRLVAVPSCAWNHGGTAASWHAASRTVPPYRLKCQAAHGLSPALASIAVSAVAE